MDSTIVSTVNVTPKAQAQAFADRCRQEGYTWSVDDFGGTGGVVLMVRTTFTPGDREAFILADNVAYSLIAMAPTVAYGSTWGTEGSGVGGHAGLVGGYYELLRSGVSKRFVNHLAKLA
jgi:hypothetical protein